jgi:tetratricopeptide (TPR) repeat protein
LPETTNSQPEIESDEGAAALADDSIAERRIAFVGKLGGVNRKEARRVVRRLGGIMVDRIDESVDMIVIGADVVSLDDTGQLLDDQVQQAVAEQKISVISETRFWQLTGVVESETDVEQLYTPAMLAELLQIPISTIRRWHRRGLISPSRQVKKLPYFDFQEVASARRIAGMVASGANPKQIENQLSQLTDLYPDVQRPLLQLSIIVEGRKVLLRDGAGLVEPGGQKRIDFGDESSDAQETMIGPATISIAGSHGNSDEGLLDGSFDVQSFQASENWSRQDFLRLAVELEDDNEIQTAIDVYRSMSLSLGPTADVCFRMAELLYQINDLPAARERYSMAVEFEAGFVEARANLGCVLVELGQVDLAMAAFAGALEHHPEYPDVHFHLARLLDDQNQPAKAWKHWAKFLELTPDGPWAEEARQRIDSIPE